MDTVLRVAQISTLQNSSSWYLAEWKAIVPSLHLQYMCDDCVRPLLCPEKVRHTGFG
jgi:hypothetical protein